MLADDVGVCFGRASLHTEGRSTEYEAVEIYRFRNGKVADRWAMVGSNPVVGALAGYAASRTMDAVTSGFLRRQSAASQHKEKELAPGGRLTQFGHQVAQATGRQIDDAAARRIGLAAHRTFGTTYGVLASFLDRRGVAPLRAGLIVRAAGFLVVDEGTSLSSLTAYRVESHLRVVVGHATLGLVLGTLLTLAERRS
ncbi:MAG TPA: hypothetical protein VFZ70_14070 [Euzebyales bacterium]